MVSTKKLVVASLGGVAALAALGIGLRVALAPAPPPQRPQNTVDHWGAYGHADQLLVPTSISLPVPIKEIGTSNSAGYALLDNGTVWAWGMGHQGQLGDGIRDNSFSRAVQVRFPPGVRIAWVPRDVMPFNTAFAVDTQGHVWGWGLNKNGELCLGNAKMQTTPVKLPFSDVTELAGAGAHAIYDASGRLYSCGGGFHGELGDGSMASSDTPAKVKGLDGRAVTALVAAYRNAGALLKNGEYFDWGLNNKGQLGNGSVGGSSDVPVRVRLPGLVRQVAEGGSLPHNGQTLVMLTDGSMYAWGDDHFYQLGNDRKGVFPSPVRFFAPSGVTYTTLATNGNASYALSTGGTVYAWGISDQGQVGDGNRIAAIRPVAVDFGVQSISATANDVAVAVSPRRGGS